MKVHCVVVNYDFKLNIDEQKDDIKHLKEQWDIYNEDELQETTVF